MVRSQHDKTDLMDRIFRSLAMDSRVLIFTSTKRMCDQLGMQLQRQIGTGVIHGDKDQREREAVLSDFKSGRRPVMIATDVAARGLDVKGVAAVINYDFPGNIEDYIHRIGRTGRAGAKGIAHTFMDASKESKYARALCEIMQKAGQKLPRELAQLAHRRIRDGDELDMYTVLNPSPDGGMLSAAAQQHAMSIPQPLDSRPECGDFKRGNCNRGAGCKFAHPGFGGGGKGGGGFGGGGYGGKGGGGGYGGGGYGGGGGGYGGGYGGGGYGGGGGSYGGGGGGGYGGGGGGYGGGGGGYGDRGRGRYDDSPPRRRSRSRSRSPAILNKSEYYTD